MEETKYCEALNNKISWREINKMPPKKKFVLFSFMRGWSLSNRIAFISLLITTIGVFVAIISLGLPSFTQEHKSASDKRLNTTIDSTKMIFSEKEPKSETVDTNSIKKNNR